MKNGYYLLTREALYRRFLSLFFACVYVCVCMSDPVLCSFRFHAQYNSVLLAVLDASNNPFSTMMSVYNFLMNAIRQLYSVSVTSLMNNFYVCIALLLISFILF